MDILTFVGFLLGLLLGFSLAWFFIHKLQNKNQESIPDSQLLKDENLSLKKDVEHLQSRIANSIEEFEKQKKREVELQDDKVQLSMQLSETRTKQDNLQEKLDHQAKELEELQSRFTQEFKLIANSILKQNSEDFSKAHQKELNEILNPLREKISSFESSVEKKYVDETKERSALKQEIKQLIDLNQTLNDQAKNLTNALKGDNKKQGNWGEMVLERILEVSGLQKGEEYETQFSDTNVDNKRIQPDIIIRLPDEKHIIVDSKVSLVSYERYSSSEDLSVQDEELKNHVISVKSHVKLLSEKNYQTGIGVNSPDFVLLFIPIESSFSLAIQGDPNLYAYAWDRKVIIVSPTTLLASLRTIASVWKHEKQTKNAIEIADSAGRLYDKFKSFVDDMQKIDRGINSTRAAYDDAFKKLKSGTGNLIRKAEQIKELGAKTTKALPSELIEESKDE